MIYVIAADMVAVGSETVRDMSAANGLFDKRHRLTGKGERALDIQCCRYSNKQNNFPLL